jgi:hypothetical protein
MRHDETRARREARAEAFEEAAEWCEDGDYAVIDVDFAAAHFRALAAAERAAHAPKPPVRYTEAPEQSRASGGACSARESITDCVEDGWTTVFPTMPLVPVVGRIYPASYPFEALDPWPDVDGGRDGA